jgi:glycosyltransferase involved in cell wall biosynthesis
MSTVQSSPGPNRDDTRVCGPIRVLHAIGSISLARGGPSVAIFNTAAALRRRGIASEVVTTDDDGPDRRIAGVAFGELTKLQDCPVRFFPLQTDFYSASLPMLRWLLANVQRYDIVHVHALFNFAPGAAAFSAWFKGVPYVVRPCGVLETWGRQNRRPWLKRNSIRFIEGPLLRRAGAMHFTSTQEKEQAAGLPMPARQAVIPLAMPLTEPCPGSDAWRPELRLQELAGRPWALYLSRLDPKKGMERLLSAFREVLARIPTAMLVVAGDGAPGYVAGLKLQASEMGLDDSVRWLGFTAGPEKHWLLANCGAFVLASSSENFGVAAVEAMAAARPVVVTSGVAISEIVTRWKAGVVTGLTTADIADGICRVLGNRPEAGEMGARGRDAVKEELSLETHGRRLEALYRELIGTSSTQRAAAS